jgi:magnesium chelatase family protein
MERFDLHLEVPRVECSDFEETTVPAETSSAAAVRVRHAREAQLRRQGRCNGRLPDAEVEKVCALDKPGRALLERSMQQLGFSARARQRILKLGRTIADLAGKESVTAAHLSEAMTYRAFDRRPELASPGNHTEATRVRPYLAKPTM